MTQKYEYGSRRAIQRLRDAGLHVTPEANSSIEYKISRVPDNPFHFGTYLLSKSLRSRVAVNYWSDEWPWIFRHWDLIPGPGHDDFDCEFPTVEQAVEAVLAFYFGQPSVIENWIVPLQLHPELSEDRVRAALGRARVITQKQFEITQAERHEILRRKCEERERPMKEWWQAANALLADHLAGKDQLEQVEIICNRERTGTIPSRPKPAPYEHYEGPMQVQFLSIPHINDTSKTLHLRRDLQEAYIVSVG